MKTTNKTATTTK